MVVSKPRFIAHFDVCCGGLIEDSVQLKRKVSVVIVCSCVQLYLTSIVPKLLKENTSQIRSETLRLGTHWKLFVITI